jgi:protein-S-isoprenylcysteine O-methyltransferase Ste14
MSINPSSAAHTAPPPTEPHKKLLLDRGVYRSNIPGSATFIGLRAADPALQYGILRYGLGSSLFAKVGLSTLPAGPPNTGTFFDALGLSPYRLIIFGMTSVTAVRQIVWHWLIQREMMDPAAAAAISAFNVVVDTLGSILFTLSATSASLSGSASFPQTPLLLGAGLFVVGSTLETVADAQVALYKKGGKNEGKLYTAGLSGLTRHANYVGYTIWRTGFAMACGGYVFSGVTAAFLLFQFVKTSIPELESYMAGKVCLN